MKSVLAHARNLWKPVADYNGMRRKERVNQYVRRFPNHEIGMDAVCYYSIASGHAIESGKVRSKEQKKMKPTPKLEMRKEKRPRRHGGRGKKTRAWIDRCV